MKASFLYQDSRGIVYDSLKDARRILRKRLREDPVSVQPFPLSSFFIKRTCIVSSSLYKYTYYGL